MGEISLRIYLHPCTVLFLVYFSSDSQIIGGSVGGVLGLMLIIGVVTIYCKISKKRTKVNKVMMKYKQGASEEVSDLEQQIQNLLKNTKFDVVTDYWN